MAQGGKVAHGLGQRNWKKADRTKESTKIEKFCAIAICSVSHCGKILGNFVKHISLSSEARQQ